MWRISDMWRILDFLLYTNPPNLKSFTLITITQRSDFVKQAYLT